MAFNTLCGLGDEGDEIFMFLRDFIRRESVIIAMVYCHMGIAVRRLKQIEPHEDKKREAAPMCAAIAVLRVRPFPASITKCSAAANIVVFPAKCGA